MGAAAVAGADRTVAAEEQDPAVLILHHRLDQRACQVDRAVEHDAANVLPLLLRPRDKGLVRPDRGVVDKDVDPPELGQRARRQRLDLVLFCDVGEHRYRLDPAVADFAYDRIGLGLVGARVDDDVSAFACELQCRGTADVAAGPGDQGDFSVELTHQRTSMSSEMERYAFYGAGATLRQF